MRVGPRLPEDKRPNNLGQRSKKARYDAEYGRTKEKAAMRALALRDLPPWIKSYRRANLKEDLEGKDLVICTQIGDLFLQIKSSAEECFKFRQKKRNFTVDVVLIKTVDDLEAIRKDILIRAERLFRKLLRDRQSTRKCA